MKRWQTCAIALVIAVWGGHSATAQDNMPAADYILIGQAIDAGRLVQAGAMLANQQLAEGTMPTAKFKILSAELALAERRDAMALAAFADLATHGVYDCRVNAGLGIALVRHRRAKEALAHLNAAAAACPDRWDVWNALGVARDLTGAWKDSEGAYEEAFRLSGQKASVMNNYGFSLLLQRRFAAAAQVFAAALRADPGNQRYANNADIARVMAGKPLGGKNGDATEDHPDNLARRLNNAGHASLLAGRSEEAKAYFSRSLHASDSYFQVASANLAAMTGGE